MSAPSASPTPNVGQITTSSQPTSQTQKSPHQVNLPQSPPTNTSHPHHHNLHNHHDPNQQSHPHNSAPSTHFQPQQIPSSLPHHNHPSATTHHSQHPNPQNTLHAPTFSSSNLSSSAKHTAFNSSTNPNPHNHSNHHHQPVVTPKITTTYGRGVSGMMGAGHLLSGVQQSPSMRPHQHHHQHPSQSNSNNNNHDDLMHFNLNGDNLSSTSKSSRTSKSSKGSTKRIYGRSTGVSSAYAQAMVDSHTNSHNHHSNKNQENINLFNSYNPNNETGSYHSKSSRNSKGSRKYRYKDYYANSNNQNNTFHQSVTTDHYNYDDLHGSQSGGQQDSSINQQDRFSANQENSNQISSSNGHQSGSGHNYAQGNNFYNSQHPQHSPHLSYNSKIESEKTRSVRFNRNTQIANVGLDSTSPHHPISIDDDQASLNNSLLTDYDDDSNSDVLDSDEEPQDVSGIPFSNTGHLKYPISEHLRYEYIRNDSYHFYKLPFFSIPMVERMNIVSEQERWLKTQNMKEVINLHTSEENMIKNQQNSMLIGLDGQITTTQGNNSGGSSNNASLPADLEYLNLNGNNNNNNNADRAKQRNATTTTIMNAGYDENNRSDTFFGSAVDPAYPSATSPQNNHHNNTNNNATLTSHLNTSSSSPQFSSMASKSTTASLPKKQKRTKSQSNLLTPSKNILEKNLPVTEYDPHNPEHNPIISENDEDLARSQSICDWYSRSELFALLELGIPLILSFSASYGVGLINLSYQGHLSEQALAAAALSLFYMNVTGISILYGLNSGIDTLGSQMFGSGQYKMVGMIAMRGAIIGLIASILVAFCWYFAHAPLLLIGIEDAVATLSQEYCSVCIWSLPALLLLDVLRRFLEVQQICLPSMFINLIGLVLVAPLNQYFMYTLDWGFIGPAYTFIIINYAMFFALLMYVYASGIWRVSVPAPSLSIFKNWWQYLSVALPAVGTIAGEWLAFELQQVIAAKLGTPALAAQSLVTSINAFIYNVPMSIGIAGCARIGCFLGARKTSAALLSYFCSLRIAWVSQICIACILYLFNNQIIGLFTDVKSVASIAQSVMPLLSIFSIVDGYQGMLQGVLRGFGAQQYAFGMNILWFWAVALPLSVFITLHVGSHEYDEFVGPQPGLGLVGIWTSLLVGSSGVMVSYLIYLGLTSWSKQTVKIYHSLLEEEFSIEDDEDNEDGDLDDELGPNEYNNNQNNEFSEEFDLSQQSYQKNENFLENRKNKKNFNNKKNNNFDHDDNNSDHWNHSHGNGVDLYDDNNQDLSYQQQSSQNNNNTNEKSTNWFFGGKNKNEKNNNNNEKNTNNLKSSDFGSSSINSSSPVFSAQTDPYNGNDDEVENFRSSQKSPKNKKKFQNFDLENDNFQDDNFTSSSYRDKNGVFVGSANNRDPVLAQMSGIFLTSSGHTSQKYSQNQNQQKFPNQHNYEKTNFENFENQKTNYEKNSDFDNFDSEFSQQHPTSSIARSAQSSQPFHLMNNLSKNNNNNNNNNSQNNNSSRNNTSNTFNNNNNSDHSEHLLFNEKSQHLTADQQQSTTLFLDYGTMNQDLDGNVGYIPPNTPPAVVMGTEINVVENDSNPNNIATENSNHLVDQNPQRQQPQQDKNANQNNKNTNTKKGGKKGGKK